MPLNLCRPPRLSAEPMAEKETSRLGPSITLTPGAIDPGAIAVEQPPAAPIALGAVDAEPWSERLRAWLPLLDAIWAAGVGLLSLRLFFSWRAVRRLCRSACPIDDPAWIERFAGLRRRLDVSRPVRLLSSASAGVPFVVGCLRPMILIPAGLLAGLAPAEVEAILAHELAHVRRHDFLVNLVQNVVETLLFYHPAVWWISAQIRREREHCCDDVAATACGGALDYAKALLAVEQLRPAGNLLVAASGGSLVGRIRRLAGADRASGSTWPIAGLVLILSATLAVVAVGRLSLAEQKEAEAVAEASAAGAAAQEEPPADEFPYAGVAVAVTDAATGQPIRSFRILAGTKAETGLVSDRFKQRNPGVTLTVWQPQTIRTGENGVNFWEPKDCFAETMFRVEADGYEPQQSAWIKRPEKAVAIALRMVKDEGIRGQILQPSGQPAAGATLAIAMIGKRTWLERGHLAGENDPLPDALRERWARPTVAVIGERTSLERGHLAGEDDPLPDALRDRWVRPTVVKTDTNGHFQLPSETDLSAAVLIVHESGAIDLKYAELRGQPQTTLKRWGSIVGKVLWKDRVGADEPVDVSVGREDEYGYPGILYQSEKAQTDDQGKFALDKVLPGRAGVSGGVSLAPGRRALGMTRIDFDQQVVQVESDDVPATVLVGGRGRTVTGRLTGRDSWQGVTLNYVPNAPNPSFPGAAQMGRKYGMWEDSSLGPLYFRRQLPTSVDGSFEIRDVLPGRYQLFVSAPGATNYVGGAACASITSGSMKPRQCSTSARSRSNRRPQTIPAAPRRRSICPSPDRRQVTSRRCCAWPSATGPGGRLSFT